ncbi:MAG: glycosyltransferase family 2 protein [Fusobacteriaceae bacterium]
MNDQKSIDISIIVPVYNSEKFIQKCMMSIINQTLKNIEIIVVNDGSTDNSFNILKEIKDERLILINKKNEGVSEARNTALKVAKGKYILNVDSDDFIDDNYCNDMYKRAEKDNLDILLSDIFDVKIKKTSTLKDLNISDDEIISGDEYLKIFFIDNFVGFNWNKLIKRELYVKNDITYNKNIAMMEDVLVLIRLLTNSKRIGKINKAYYHYVQHLTNVTSELKNTHLENINLMFEEAAKYLKGKTEVISLLWTRASYIKLGYILGLKEVSNSEISIFFKTIPEKIDKKVIFSFKTKILLKIIKSFKFKFIVRAARILKKILG